MIVDGKQIRPIWLDEDRITVKVIDQRQLPHQFVVADLATVDQVIHAIRGTEEYTTSGSDMAVHLCPSATTTSTATGAGSTS